MNVNSDSSRHISSKPSSPATNSELYDSLRKQGSPVKSIDLYESLFALEKKKCTCPFASGKLSSNCTVCNGSIVTDGKVYSKKLFLEKLVLNDKGEEVIEKEEYTKLYEKAKNDKSLLRLNFIRGCDNTRKADFPLMPSLALDMLHKNYDEPIRDRDKLWKLTSQRDILNRKGKEILCPDFMLELGKYKSIDSSSPLFWDKGFQAFIRESRLYRIAKIVSDTPCIVSIYGQGINGRVLSNGSSAGKLIILEAYSIWNSEKYMRIMSIMDLRVILQDKPDLFKPGMKRALIDELINLVYFKYV
jgi:hypothetical protein